jgi:hypothetical protein
MPTRDDVRQMALTLPEAYEDTHRRAPSFRVQARIFCTLPNDVDWIVLKLEREDQLNMIEGHPDVVGPARHYSHHGWTYVWPERADEALLWDQVRLAWTHVAPKRLVRRAG